MKIKSLFVAVLLMGGVFVSPAHASEKPTVESFTFSPQEIDLSEANTTVTFELIVSSPSGIEPKATLLTLKNSLNSTLATYLTPQDSVSTNTKITFKGSLAIPRNANPGVYAIYAAGVKYNSASGFQSESGIIEAGKVRTLVGAENGLLVRSGGDLNFDYATFVGPAYDTSAGFSYNNPSKFNTSNAPIWKVGEKYDPTQYFELRVPTLSLVLTSSSPAICSTDGKTLSLIREGSCSFNVSTAKTKDYIAKISSQSATITAARTKPTLAIGKIVNQDVKDLGKSIEIGGVYGASEGWVLPQSATPTICFASGFYVKLIAGGTCKLTYQTGATSTYLASDVYTISFDILKDGQPVFAPTPVATPSPTPTVKPVVKKTITCTKGTKSVKRTGTAPKCPAGYKLKK